MLSASGRFPQMLHSVLHDNALSLGRPCVFVIREEQKKGPTLNPGTRMISLPVPIFSGNTKMSTCEKKAIYLSLYISLYTVCLNHFDSKQVPY